jgi:hypothetical protein
MKINLKYIVPTKEEVATAGVISLFIVLLSNSKRLLSYYGLQSTDEVIKTNAGNAVTGGLQVLDSFSLTNSVVTFLIWAVVGIICFALVESLAGAYGELKLERQITSNRYIHPTNFSNGKFWRGVFYNTLSLFFGLTLLAVATMFFMLVILPSGLAYSRSFLFLPSAQNALYLLIGLMVLSVGLLLIDIAIRFMLNRRRLVRTA